MDRKYQNKLISIYPEMFLKDWKPSLSLNIKNYFYRLIGRDEIYPKSYESFSFACKDGWVGILSELISKIKYIDYKNGIKTKAFQVKEKFGGLRFYTDGVASDEVWAVIIEYMNKSYGVCEYTGSRTNVGLWCFGAIKTMSKEYALQHYENFKNENKNEHILFENCWTLKPFNEYLKEKGSTL